jgi:hypothetical protein
MASGNDIDLRARAAQFVRELVAKHGVVDHVLLAQQVAQEMELYANEVATRQAAAEARNALSAPTGVPEAVSDETASRPRER